MADVWNRNEEVDGDEELVVTDHRDDSAPLGESLDENAPEEQIPLAEARALEDSDQLGATMSPKDRRGEPETEEDPSGDR